jgi:hypothetical protein
MDAVLEGRADLRDLTRRGRNYALTRHSMPAVTAQYLELYRNLLARP